MEFSNLDERFKFIVSRWAYSVGEPIISDAEYTMLLDFMKVRYPDDEYVNRSWSSDPCPTKLLESIGREDLIHKVVIADKTTSIPSLGTENEVFYTLSGVSKPGTLSMKHDGWNVQANYFNGNKVNLKTRGRDSDALDVSKLLDYLPDTIPVMGSVKIAMELTCPKESFQFCAQMFGNVSERAAVHTLLAHPEYYHLLAMTAFDIHGYNLDGKNKFEVLESWGFSVPEWYNVTTYDDIRAALDLLSEHAENYPYPTDGAVYDGESRHAIRLQHWEEPIYKSYITGYLEQFGPNRISPSLLIRPVLRKGTTQRRINITNWQRIMDNNLQPGYPVAFRVASSATADFDEATTRLLQKQWIDNLDEYKKLIDENEERVKCQWDLYANGVLS